MISDILSFPGILRENLLNRDEEYVSHEVDRYWPVFL